MAVGLLRSTPAASLRRTWVSRRLMRSSSSARCCLTRPCIKAVTVPVKRWMTVFSPQPMQAPSPETMDW